MAAGRCKSCKNYMLSDSLLGLVILELHRLGGLDPALVLRGLGAHLRWSGTNECAVCVNRREAKELERQGLFVSAMLARNNADDAERLFATEAYGAGVLQQIKISEGPHAG